MRNLDAHACNTSPRIQTMKTANLIACLIISILFLEGCAGSPFRPLKENELLENTYISVRAIDSSWDINNKYKNGESYIPHLYKNVNGSSFMIDTYDSALPSTPNQFYFDKNAKYVEILKDEDMALTNNDREQGSRYYRDWISYIKGKNAAKAFFHATEAVL